MSGDRLALRAMPCRPGRHAIDVGGWVGMSAPRLRPLAEVLKSWDDIVEEWALWPIERSMLIGGCARGAVDDIETYRVLCGETRMRALVELAPILRRQHGGARQIQRWLRRCNPNLGDRAPLDVMSCSPEWVQWFVDHLGTGQ